MAISIGSTTSLHVILLYLGVQTIGSHFIAPQIQKKAAGLPAPLTNSAQVPLGTLVGALGLVLATPMVAVTMVVVREIRVKDWIGRNRRSSYAARMMPELSTYLCAIGLWFKVETR